MPTSEHSNQSASATIDATKLAAAKAEYLKMDPSTRVAFDNWLDTGARTLPVVP